MSALSSFGCRGRLDGGANGTERAVEMTDQDVHGAIDLAADGRVAERQMLALGIAAAPVAARAEELVALRVVGEEGHHAAHPGRRASREERGGERHVRGGD